jgi:transcriptional antiterminator RfaH
MRVQSPAHHLAAGQAWYLIHCKPNSEKIAFYNLKNQDFFAFLPMQKRTLRKNAAFQTKLHPLFPGYIFVAQNPTAGHWRKINNTRGVARMVCFASEPNPVPLIIMDQIFARCDENSVFQQRTSFIAGDDAKIVEGPLAGAFGKIVEIEPDKRVHLLLDFMGQKSTLAINSASVVPTS